MKAFEAKVCPHLHSSSSWVSSPFWVKLVWFILLKENWTTFIRFFKLGNVWIYSTHYFLPGRFLWRLILQWASFKWTQTQFLPLLSFSPARGTEGERDVGSDGDTCGDGVVPYPPLSLAKLGNYLWFSRGHQQWHRVLYPLLYPLPAVGGHQRQRGDHKAKTRKKNLCTDTAVPA